MPAQSPRCSEPLLAQQVQRCCASSRRRNPPYKLSTGPFRAAPASNWHELSQAPPYALGWGCDWAGHRRCPCGWCSGSAGTLLAGIDWRTRQLPGVIVNSCLLLVATLAGTASVVTADWLGLLRAAAGWAVGGALFGLIWLASPRSLGYGDVRLAALLGMSLNWLNSAAPLPGLFLALVLAAANGLLLRATHRLERGQPIPLGPFPIAGAVVAALLQPA